MGNRLAKRFMEFIICVCLFTILFILQTTSWASGVTPPISPNYIIITNNPIGQPNTVTIIDPNIMANDVINLYKTNTDPNAIDTFIVADPNNAVFFTYAFGSSVSTVYISRKSLYSLESTRTTLTLPTAADPNYTGFSAANISAVINRINMPGEVDVIGILSGDIIRVYNAQTGGVQIGTGIAASTSATVYIPDLGVAAGTVYVTRQTPSNTESPRFAKSFIKKPPKIASIVALKGCGSTTSLEPNDLIIINFDANTCKPAIDGNNINQFLRVYDPNGIRHSWGGNLNDANDSFTQAPDITAAWNTVGNQLTVTFNNDTSTVTLAIGDTIKINASANLKDAASTTAASSAISPGISGTFVPTPVIISAVAADTGNNLGLGCNDSVIITFSGPTNEPNFVANINTWLNPTSNAVTHIWATTPSSSIAGSWNADANVLTVTFRNNVGSTIRVGDTLTLSTNAHLEDNGNTTPDSNCSVTITGTFTSAPTITSLVASNDGNNFGLGVGDKIRMTFNQYTNKPTIDSNNLDSLFRLNNSHTWGDDPNIVNSWDVTGQVLTLTFNDIANSTIWIGDTITIDPNANIKDALATTSGTSASSTLTGSFSSAPKIVNVVAANTGNNVGLGLGDTVTITFNEPTNKMNNLLTPANINLWLKLSNSHSWGTGLDSNAIIWDANGDQLRIIFDSNSSITGATVIATDHLTIDANAGLKEPNSTTPASTSDCNFSGSFTWAPQIVIIVASDDSNIPGLAVGNKVKITFDQKTNKPTVTSTNINSWFHLYADPNDPNTIHSWGTTSNCVGTPTWDANGILLTVQFNNVTGSTIEAGDTLVIDANAVLKDAALTTGASTNSGVITGTFTSSPAIVSAVASNDANGIGLQPGDKVTITFNQNTNMPTITPADINNWLRLSYGHLWGGDLDGNNPDANIWWDPNGRILTIKFNSVAGSTITARDTITIDANAGISDYDGTVPASTAMATMSGSFTLAPQIVSAVAYNTGNNYGLGAGDKVVITFNQPTNKDPNFKNNLTNALKLCLATDPNQVHVWGSASGNTINTISDANWDANGVIFTIIFNSAAATSSSTVRANDNIWAASTTLKDAGNTIAANSNKIAMTGTFTYSMGITSTIATSGGIFGSDANATVQLVFNQNTNKPAIQPNNIDNLLKLSSSHSWGTVSSVTWDANGIKLTINYGVSTGSPTIAIGDYITIDANAGIKDVYGTTTPCISSKKLSGAFNPPTSIVSAVMANGSGTSGVLDANDSVTITFNEATNTPYIAAGNMDNYLVPSRGDSWGTGLQDSDIVWTNLTTLVITFLDITNTTITPGDTITIDPGADITDLLGTTNPSTASVVSTGGF